jgi:sugar lactone lactonase YvrE
MFWYAAAAMLMLAVVGGLAATRFGAPGSNGTRSGSIAAPLISPVATPGVSEVVFAWQTNGDPADPMKNATNLAIAPDGSIWVPDGQHGRFQIFSAEGELLDVWGRHGSGPGEFDFTTAGFEGYARGAIAFAPDGSFYVADTGNRRIQKFAADRSFLTSWGSEGLGDGQFVGISDLAVDSQGRVFVIDPSKAFDASGVPTGADTVQVFDADGTFLNSWGAPDNTTGALATPMGITIDWDGTVLAANLHSNRIERFTADGEHLGGWGDFGIREGQMFRPMDVAVDRQGNVYEVDYSNGRVQVFDQAGRFLMAWGQVGKGDGQFTGPVAVAIDDEGNVYITDDAGRLQKFHVVLTP